MLAQRNRHDGTKSPSPESSGGGFNVTVNSNTKRKRRQQQQRKKKWQFLSFCLLTVFFLFFLNFWGHHRIMIDSKVRIQEAREILHSSSNAFMNGTTLQQIQGQSPSSPSRSSSSGGGNNACDGFQGIYHIEKGDIGGAAGTIFFQFVIGQIIWAEKYNFKPWIYFNNVSYVIYDPLIHGQHPGVSFSMMEGLKISYVQRPNGHWRDAIPGEPYDYDKLKPKLFHFEGDGVWENYFEPISDFLPGDSSCQHKSLVTMDLYQVTPGVHGFAPWAPRCWRYTYLPDYVTKPHIPLHEWLEPQRHLAHDVLTRYIQFKPYIREKAEQINPNCSMTNACLAIHIRQSDKAAGRRQIQTDEFLPYIQAFLISGGSWVYLATDSAKVIQHVKTKWPQDIQERVRSIGENIIRSDDQKAVFDIASHHQTNTEILIEILALAKCQFIVHGLSAVTETSIWINVDLHYTAVNLEDPDHLDPTEFRTMVKSVLEGKNATEIYREQRPTDWWRVERMKERDEPTHQACDDVDGVLLIEYVGSKAGAGEAFFTSVLNQLYYAEMNNLKPWIHLGFDGEYILDKEIHDTGPGVTLDVTNSVPPFLPEKSLNRSLAYPGKPISQRQQSKSTHLEGDGIWTHYFHQVSDFVPGDCSCDGKPVHAFTPDLVTPGTLSYAPWAIRPWRNDDVPDDIWKPENLTLKEWIKPMRKKASRLVQKYFKFHPRLVERANEVNPMNDTSVPCLAVHLRNSDKGKNKYRSKFPVNKFREFLQAFIRAGGQTIYIATDSNSVLEHIELRYPAQIRNAIRTQGTYVVRSSSKWPIHMLEKHHRTNSEALVDVLAMAKCKLLLHGHSTLSEAAIYLNPDLHETSVNWEDPDHLNAFEFEQLARKVLGTTNDAPVELLEDVDPGDIVVNPTIVKGDDERSCRKNAVIYLAQKKHSSYDRDSYGILLRSLELLEKNYLSINNHRDNTDVIIFHTSDFDSSDLDVFEQRFEKAFRDGLHLVDLNGTKYWKRPQWHKNDNPLEWYAYPLFSEGYRRMMHWFAIDIWQYFQDHKRETGCDFQYIMRFDEDSFLHSPIRYDVFDFMRSNDYSYGFRLCAYEMQVTQRIWKLWRSSPGSTIPLRDIDLEMCGVYNNFFVAKVSFFLGKEVQKFLSFVDRQGLIYRRRLGDLMIHSMAIYSFAPKEKIHRFLDFTYEHATTDEKTGCVVWGGIQAGYDDPNGGKTVANFLQEKVLSKNCNANVTTMERQDLSPSYGHLPDRLGGEVFLESVMAGKVELPNKGILSG